MTVEQAMDLALTHHRAGRLREAELIYRQILTTQPQHSPALHLLGTLALQLGNINAAIDLLQQAIRIQPGFADFHANLGTALGNQTMNVLIAASVYLIYGYLWTNFRVYTISLNVYSFFVLLILMDFFSYWVHRWGHAINILWAVHSPHHSAEEMNIFVGLRASVTQRVFTFSVLWPLTLIGFRPFDIYLVNGIHLFIALFQHVTWTGKTDMGQGPVDMTIQYRLIAAGSVLEERCFAGTPNEMVTMYYDKAGKLAMTHYCVMGNRPEMALKASDGKSLTFDLDASCCTFDAKKDSHMHGVTIQFDDADTVTTSCKAVVDGKEMPAKPTTFKRVKS